MPRAECWPRRDRGRVIAKLRRKRQVSPVDSLSSTSTADETPPARFPCNSWVGDSTHSPSAQALSFPPVGPNATCRHSQPIRCRRSACWSHSKTATSTSLWARVWHPRYRSIAQPPTMNQGRSKTPARLATACGAANGSVGISAFLARVGDFIAVRRHRRVCLVSPEALSDDLPLPQCATLPLDRRAEALIVRSPAWWGSRGQRRSSSLVMVRYDGGARDYHVALAGGASHLASRRGAAGAIGWRASQ